MSQMSSRPHTPVNTSAQEELDEKIQTIQLLRHEEIRKIRLLRNEEIRKLAERRNSLSPVSRMPPEILSIIFLEYTSGLKRRAFRISHVCRYWRDVAIACPRLWCKITPMPKYPKQTIEILRRSKQVPLYLTLNLHDRDRRWDKNRKALRLVLEQTPRVVLLNLTVDKSVSIRDLSGLAQPAPLLETLELNPAGLIMESLPLFNGQTPRLREVTLDKFYFADHVNSFLLKNLQSLEITSPLERPTFDQMFSILAESPLLETLSLTDAIPPCPEDFVELPRLQGHTHLSHLRSLMLVDFAMNCTYFMGHLNLAHTPQMKFTCAIGRSTPSQLSLFFSIVNSLSTRSTAPPLLSASINSCENGSYAIGAWTTVEERLQSQPARLSLWLGPVDDIEEWSKYLELPFSHIQDLNLQDDGRCEGPRPSSKGLLNALRASDQIRSVTVDDSFANDFVSMLTEHLIPTPIPQQQPLFPCLQQLNFKKEVSFWGSVTGFDLLGHLERFLRYRHAQGSPLLSLDLRWIRGINSRHIDRCKKFVKTVNWEEDTSMSMSFSYLY